MKRTLLLLLTALCLTTQAQAQLPKIYDESLDPMQQIDAAVAQAAQTGKFVVCQVGGNWCPWCLKFADFITHDSDISTLIGQHFVYIHVDYNPRRSAGETKKQQAEAIQQRLGRPARFGFPVLVVLDSEGKVLHIQDSGLLEEGEGYNQKRVLRFFKCWTPDVVKH